MISSPLPFPLFLLGILIHSPGGVGAIQCYECRYETSDGGSVTGNLYCGNPFRPAKKQPNGLFSIGIGNCTSAQEQFPEQEQKQFPSQCFTNIVIRGKFESYERGCDQGSFLKTPKINITSKELQSCTFVCNKTDICNTQLRCSSPPIRTSSDLSIIFISLLLLLLTLF